MVTSDNLIVVIGQNWTLFVLRKDFFEIYYSKVYEISENVIGLGHIVQIIRVSKQLQDKHRILTAIYCLVLVTIS